MSTKENFVKALRELTGFDDEQSEAKKQPVKIEPVRMEVETPKAKEPEFAKTVNAGLGKSRTSDFGTFSKGNQTVIPKGMRIIGNIESEGRIEVLGRVDGDIVTKDDAIITGTIVGNVTGGNLLLQNCGVKGNLKSDGNITVEREAKVVGNVFAENLHLDGKIKGDIKVNQTADMANGALVIGDIETQYISTSRGTKIKGSIITNASGLSTDDEDFDIEV